MGNAEKVVPLLFEIYSPVPTLSAKIIDPTFDVAIPLTSVNVAVPPPTKLIVLLYEKILE